MRKVLIAILALCGGAAIGVYLVRDRAPAVAEATNPVDSQHENKVALSVLHESGKLRVMWNPNAEPVRSATRGVLEIDDGNHLSRMELGSDLLKSGMATYWPQSREVTFRLEIDGEQGKNSGTIRAPGIAAEAKPSPFDAPSPRHRALRKVPVQPSPVVVADRSEPERHSRLSRAVGKIPLFRRFKKSHRDD